MNVMMLLNPLFPFDPTLDSGLEHRHLILAYVVVLIVQMGYLFYLLRQYIGTRRTHSEAPTHRSLEKNTTSE
jgi:hypothetical protein